MQKNNSNNNIWSCNEENDFTEIDVCAITKDNFRRQMQTLKWFGQHVALLLYPQELWVNNKIGSIDQGIT